MEFINEKELKGDLVSHIIDFQRQEKKAWDELSEAQQKDRIQMAEIFAEDAIRKMVRTIASENRAVIQATVEQVVVKDGIKAVLTLSKSSEHRYELMDAQGDDVLLVVANSDKFMGGEMPQPDPDQKSFDFEKKPKVKKEVKKENKQKHLPSPEEIELVELKEEATKLGIKVKEDWDINKLKSAIDTYKANNNEDFTVEGNDAA